MIDDQALPKGTNCVGDRIPLKDTFRASPHCLPMEGARGQMGDGLRSGPSFLVGAISPFGEGAEERIRDRKTSRSSSEDTCSIS
jgi:hypothetical protein